MSGAHIPGDDATPTAVPVADLSVIDIALEEGPEALREAVKKVRPADVGRDLSRRPLSEARAIVSASDDRRGAAMLRSAHPAVAAKTIGTCEPERAACLLAFMPTDHRVAILAQATPQARERIEAALLPEDKAMLERSLRFHPSAVGRLMTPKIWRAEAGDTAAQAIAILRERSSDIEVAQNCYVVDNGGLVGVAPLRELAIAAPETPLRDLMTRDPISVSEDAERGSAADIIRTHDFLSLPVVDRDKKLVGAVRVDDLLDAALEKVGVGILNQGAVAGDIATQLPYFQTPLHRVVRSRITWLVLLFVAETLTGTVLRTFEDELAKVVALSFFVPLLIGTGGNAGSQTVSTVIRALALGEVRISDMLRVVGKELLTGVALGLLLGAIAFGRSLLWGVGVDLAACVAVTILVVCIWANTVGAAVPLLAQRLRIDPTVVSAPLITTVVDATGLFIYFSVAHLMIAQLH